MRGGSVTKERTRAIRYYPSQIQRRAMKRLLRKPGRSFVVSKPEDGYRKISVFVEVKQDWFLSAPRTLDDMLGWVEECHRESWLLKNFPEGEITGE